MSIVLVAVCIGVLIWALVRANAAWHFIAAQAIAEPLIENGVGGEAVFDEAELHINTALRRFPNNPDYLDFAGRLDILQSSQPGVMGAERRAYLNSAADNFRQALEARPLWPYSWASLLAVQDRLGQVDMEFNLALNRSVELGPWEPGVQLQVVDTGLRYWDRLGNAERLVVQQKTHDAFKVQPRSAFALVKDYGRPDLVCDDRAGQHREVQQWCDNVLK